MTRPEPGVSAARTSSLIRRGVEAVRAASDLRPRVALVLGTGLGGLAEAIDVEAALDYRSVPGFPEPTVETHSGRLLLGHLEGVEVVAMQGRHHRYEGHTLHAISVPIRVLRSLGAEILILSNASGGMNPLWSPGDLVLIDDHINLLGDNPLIGPNLDEFGPRFPDMSEAYDRELQRVALDCALARGTPLRRGVYVAVSGPNLETRAEYRMLRGWGADVVGMSTVPEVIVARHMGMRVLAVSVITDACLPDALEATDVEAILRVAARAEPHLTRLIRDVVAALPS